MKNLTGITLNGEWLGNNVLINGMFRNICTISPVVMQEFIHLINGIDQLDEAVFIQNYKYKDKNTIDIEFANNELNGLASLYFNTNNENTEVINSFLKLNRNEDQPSKVSEGVTDVEEAVKAQKTRAKKAKKAKREILQDENSVLDGTYSDDDYEYEDEEVNYSDDESYSDEEITHYYDSQNDYCDDEDISENTYQPGSYDGYACEDENYPAPAQMPEQGYMRGENQVAEIKASNIVLSQSSVENGSEQAVVSNSEEFVNNAEKENEYYESKKTAGKTEKDEAALERSVQHENRPRHRAEQSMSQRGMRGQNQRAQAVPQAAAPMGRGRGQVTANSDQQSIVITANSINITPSDFEPENRRGSKSRRSSEALDNIEEKQSQVNNQEFVEKVEAEKTEDLKEERHIIIPEIINENYNPEDISEFLADFYTSDKIEAELTREQALLAEIANLKEEINELHGQQRGSAEEEAETPMTLEEFYARQMKKKESKANTYGYTFRILGTNKRIRANVVDPELFIAGDKLYKWGEMLYLTY